MYPSSSTTAFCTAFSLIRRSATYKWILQPFNYRYIHISPSLPAGYARGSTKKTEIVNKNRRGKPQPVGLKKTESKKPVATIFNGITLRQLTASVDMNRSELEELVLEIAPERIAEKCLEDPDAPLDNELVLRILSALGMRPRIVQPPKVVHLDESELDIFPQPPPSPSECQKRAPLVTIMGHVDHGKTTLLDAMRSSNIVAQEHGGITQHIGAFSVKLPDVGNEPVTFLDTPGHSAFKSMRERGARATDIVVLVVAADDGVMEQTVESIRYAREAGVPMIVAINKCDKPGVDPENVLNDLLHHDIVPEKFGGDTLVVEISALYGRGIDKVQEAILLQSELMNLVSTPKGPVEATIIESTCAQGLGNVCTVIVNRGTLRKGTILVAGTSWGRVRSMTNEFNAQVQEAGPSTPVRISGWRQQLPAPGELALEAPSEQKAQAVVEFRRDKKQEVTFIKDMEVVEQKRDEARQLYHQKRMEKLQRGILSKMDVAVPSYITQSDDRNDVPELAIILKCDVDGTLEAIQQVLDTYDSEDQVRLQIADSGVGPPSEQDVEWAAEIGAHVLCFNTSISNRIQEMANQQKVELEKFNVIYKLVERLKELLTSQIKPKTERRLLGMGTVLQEYRILDGQKKRQPIAGIRVDSGALQKDAIWRFMRLGSSSPKDGKKRPKSKYEKQQQKTVDKEQKDADITAEIEQPTSFIIYEGPIESMQQEKQLVTRASIDMQVGVAIADKNVRYKEDDLVEVYEEVPVEEKIRWNPPGF